MSTKGNYLAWFEARTQAHLNQNPATFLIESPIGQERVAVQTRWGNQFGRQIVEAIELEITLDASSLDEAINLAGSRANRWLAALSFAGRAPVEDARLLLAYDVTPNKLERPFLQRFYQDLWSRSLQVHVDPAVLQGVINGWGQLEGKRHWAASRAFYWYRRALRAGDPADRFTYLWLGLEALEPMLREKLNIPQDDARCPSCNKLLQDPSTAGIRGFLQNVSSQERLYRRARQLRVNLLHTVSSDYEVEKEAQELSEPLESALRTAVKTVADISGQDSQRTVAFGGLLCTVKGRFLGVTQVGPHEPHPHFILSRHPTSEEASDYGLPLFDAKLVPSAHFDFRIDGWLLPQGVRIRERTDTPKVD